MILTRSTRLSQPQGPVELDYTNPLLSGHSFLWSAAHDVRKSLIGSQRLATVVGGYAPSTEGKSWKAASGKPVAFPLGENFISTSDGVGTGDFTLWVLANPEASTTLRDLVTQASTASGPDSGCIALRANSSSGSMSFLVGKGLTSSNFDILTATAQTNGSVKLFMGRRQGTELSLWTDGRKVASGTYAIRQVRPLVSGSYDSSAFSIGCNAWSTGQTGVHNNIMAGGANRALSDDEIARLSSNPWQLFRPVQRRVYFDMGAGGGATTSVNADLGADYTIRSTVQSDGSGAYAIRAEVAADASSGYGIRGVVSADAAVSYVVRAPALADLPSAFTVRGFAQADAASTFTVRGGAASDATAAYLLRGSASSDLSASYDIQTASGVSSSLYASYVVRGAVQSDAAAAYDLRKSVGATSEHAFMVRGLVSSDLDASYTVEAPITQVYADLQAAYLVDGGAVFIPSQFVASVPAGVFSARAQSGEYSATVPAGNYRASI